MGQKKSEKTTYLFVAVRLKDNIKVFRATVDDMVPSFMRGSEIELPKYYPERPSSLFILSTRLIPSSLQNYEVASTKRDAIDALNITRTTMMYIREKVTS